MEILKEVQNQIDDALSSEVEALVLLVLTGTGKREVLYIPLHNMALMNQMIGTMEHVKAKIIAVLEEREPTKTRELTVDDIKPYR